MKARIYINRHVLKKNKEEQVDLPAISIRTYKGTISCKRVDLRGNGSLIQDMNNPVCSGAVVWIEAEFEDLLIDGQEADRSMLHRS